jgi:hypothetical protein
MSDEKDNLKIVEILKKDILAHLQKGLTSDIITFTDDNTISEIEKYLSSFFDKDGLLIDFGERVTTDNYKKFVQIWVILIIMNERALPKNANNERRLNHLIIVVLDNFDPPKNDYNVSLREDRNLKIINILIEDTLNYLQQNDHYQLITLAESDDYKIYFDGDKSAKIYPGEKNRNKEKETALNIKTSNGSIIYNINVYVEKLKAKYDLFINDRLKANYKKFVQIFLILFFINERALKYSHTSLSRGSVYCSTITTKTGEEKENKFCVSVYYEVNKTELTQLINLYLKNIVTVTNASDSFTVTDPAGGNFTHKTRRNTSRRYRKSIRKTRRRQRKTKRKANRRKTRHH